MSSFISNPITSASKNINTLQSNCRKYKGFVPSVTPVINNLSVYTSVAGAYTQVYINGYNFFPYGSTYVYFSNGYNKIPVIYLSSFNISFTVPVDISTGNYEIYVVNIYNGILSPNINNSYAGNLIKSNSVTYSIT